MKVVLILLTLYGKAVFGQNDEFFEVLKYTSQKDLDTLGYAFVLKDAEVEDSNVEIWPNDRLSHFERKIDTLTSLNTLSSSEYLDFPFELVSYYKQGQLIDRLPKILRLVGNQEIPIHNFISYQFFGERIIDHILIEGTPPEVDIVKKTLIERLHNGSIIDYRTIAPLLNNEDSDAYFQALQKLGQNVAGNDFLEMRYFYEVAPELMRLQKNEAIPIILNSYKKELKRTVEKERAINHLNFILEIGQDDHENDTIFQMIALHQDSILNFNQNQILGLHDVDEIISLAFKFGLIDSVNAKPIKYQLINKIYQNYYGRQDLDLLEVFNVIVCYNSDSYQGTGHFTDKARGYRTDMEKFMAVTQKDIPLFYFNTHFKYDQNADPNFALFLGNSTTGYVIRLDPDMLLDENHVAISQLFNAVLMNQKCQKRFVFEKEQGLGNEHLKVVFYQSDKSIDRFLQSVQKL